MNKMIEMRFFRACAAVCGLLCAAAVSAAPVSDTGRTLELTLERTLELARKQSVDAAVALNSLKSAYWQYRTFRAERLPELTFSGTLPSYNNKFSAYQHEDGSYTYVRNNWLSLSGNLSITQNLPFTGGTLSLNTSLEMSRQLGRDAFNEFLAVPVSLTWQQPLFAVNPFKWDNRIEPVRYREARASYVEQMEQVNVNAVVYFFNYLLSIENLHIAGQNLENAERLYRIAREKRRIGQISETELMQLNLASLEARADVTAKQSSLNASMFQLRAFLGLSERDSLQAVLPGEVPLLRLDYAQVLDKALANNAFAQNVLRRQLEADYNVAKARGERYEVNLFATLGYSGVDRDVAMVYGHLQDQQVVSVGVSVPILDWGKRKGRVKVAESDRQVVESQLEQERLQFNQDLFLLVEQFNNQSGQLRIAEERDRVAAARYRASMEAFLLGTMNVLELNDARDAKDDARRTYIQELFSYWSYYYRIRSVTLWDFAAAAPLQEEIDALVAE